MRRWFKYLLNCSDNVKYLPIDQSFEDHARTMGGYTSDIGYTSQDDFFQVYFYNGHARLKAYAQQLSTKLERGEKILSIGSGRCVNELLLMKEGHDVICSDLTQPCKEATMKIFPNLHFVEFDIISSPFRQKVDSIISLSVFYLFDKDMLQTVFKHVAMSLNKGGKFIFDPGGATNSFWTRTMDEVICKYEAYLKAFLFGLLGRKNCVVTKKHHGYRNTNQEVVAIAESCGFKLVGVHCSDPITEVERAWFLRHLVKKYSPLRRLICKFGSMMPYVRMFAFKLE